MSDSRLKCTVLDRRSFALGVAGVSATAALGPGALGTEAHAADHASAPNGPSAPGSSPASDRHGTFFHEQTLWDSVEGPLVNYHVHALAVLPDDTVLAVTEGRHEVCDAGPRDLLLRRSTDGGATWEASRPLVTSGRGLRYVDTSARAAARSASESGSPLTARARISAPTIVLRRTRPSSPSPSPLSSSVAIRCANARTPST